MSGELGCRICSPSAATIRAHARSRRLAMIVVAARRLERVGRKIEYLAGDESARPGTDDARLDLGAVTARERIGS